MENFVEFAALAGLLSFFLSPFVVSLVKNIGGDWPDWAKNLLAVIFAGIASFVAIGQSAGWATIDPLDYAGFWQPLIAGMTVTFPVQYAAWKGIWSKTRLDAALANFGNGAGP
jgi:hypothetical protein